MYWIESRLGYNCSFHSIAKSFLLSSSISSCWSLGVRRDSVRRSFYVQLSYIVFSHLTMWVNLLLISSVFHFRWHCLPCGQWELTVSLGLDVLVVCSWSWSVMIFRSNYAESSHLVVNTSVRVWLLPSWPLVPVAVTDSQLADLLLRLLLGFTLSIPGDRGSWMV
jgi:hypothetical protein